MTEQSLTLGKVLAGGPTVLGTALRYAWSGSPHPKLGLSGMVKAAFVKRMLALGEAEAKDQAKLTMEQRLATVFAKSVLVRPELLQPADAKYYEGELSHPAVKPGPVPAFYLTPRKAVPEDKIVLYIHGGGYGRGDATGAGISNGIANKLGRLVCTIDYRLGDTEPFPAAVQDCITAYFHLRKTYAPEQIMLAGDSAGGGLVLATLLHLRTLSERPDRALLFSPVIQTQKTDYGSWLRFARDDMITAEGLSTVSAGYVSLRPDSRYIQLFQNSFSGLPPLFVTYGDAEILADDDRAFCEAARRDGVEVVEDVGVAKMHVWIVLPIEQTDAKPVWARIKQFADAGNAKAKL